MHGGGSPLLLARSQFDCPADSRPASDNVRRGRVSLNTHSLFDPDPHLSLLFSLFPSLNIGVGSVPFPSLNRAIPITYGPTLCNDFVC